MRLIDADALLEHVWDADTRVGYVQVVDRQDIENAPTIEPRPQRWIPVDEGRPKDGTDCLVTYSHGWVEIATFAEDLYEVDEYNFHDKRGVEGWFYLDDEYGYQEYSDVIAWQPLPEPYGGKE